MNKILRCAVIAAAASLLAVLAPAAQAAESEGWDWMVAPYGWAASIGTDLRSGQPPYGGASSDTNFDDIIDKFDGAFQIHAEGQGDNFGAFTDFTFLGLADDKNHPRFHSESDLDARLFEIAAVWSPAAQRHHGIELFAGLRYIDVDATVQLDPENPLFDTTRLDGGASFSDFMLGARYTWAISDRWGVTFRGDGSFGETDGTWNTSIVANYKMKHGAWLLGYRYLSVEMETHGNRFDTTMKGPMVGYGFMF